MRRVLLQTLPLLFALSCSSQNPARQPGSPDSNPTTNQPGSAPAVLATGWSEVSMIANFAKTTLDGTGHFLTSRNACGREADGALDLTAWNKIATAVNAAVQAINAEQNRPIPVASPSPGASSVPSTSASDDHCYDTETFTKMDGLAEVSLGESPNGPKKTLLDARGRQICVKFSNQQVAMQLFDALTTVVLAADKEDCPNGWGSN